MNGRLVALAFTAYAGFAGIYLFPVIALGQLLVLRALRAGQRRFRSV